MKSIKIDPATAISIISHELSDSCESTIYTTIAEADDLTIRIPDNVYMINPQQDAVMSLVIKGRDNPSIHLKLHYSSFDNFIKLKEHRVN